MDAERNKEIVRRFVAAVNARDRDEIAALVTPNVCRRSPATPGVTVNSFEDLWAFLEQDFASIPDSVVTIVSMVAEGDQVAVWATYAGTQTGQMGPFPPSNGSATLEFAGFLRIREDRISEMRVVWDNVDMLTQLGHMEGPPG